jgi:heme exporter protein A
LVRISIDVPAGAAVLLTGDNGSGKTTLLRVLATALRPTHGNLSLFGLNARDHLAQVRSRVALLTHQNYLYDGLSARENLALSARMRGVAADQGRLDATLDRVGLLPHASRTVGDFSAGMKVLDAWCFVRATSFY